MAISRLDRAKQFMPFDALKGLQEALRSKEIEYEKKRELSEEEQEKISAQLCLLDMGDNIKIKYYFHSKYITIEGIVKKIDSIKKVIILVDENVIKFDDILDIIRM